MLQKEFFGVESFNPRPYFDNTILNLSGASKFEADTIFKPGIYSVDIQAGSGYYGGVIGNAAKIVKNIVVGKPFIIRAYCGGSASSSSGGINPYSGAFKVSAYMTQSDVPSVSHIFGNSGSTAFGAGNPYPTSGNCLGDGAYVANFHGGSGAGSCLHLLPVGGTFGTDYLFAFHTTAAPMGNAGSGSAYGGAGSGAGSRVSVMGAHISMSSYNAGSTSYGNGGIGVSAPGYDGEIAGNNGTGIGYGYGGISSGVNGAGAWFDGTNWQDSRSVGAVGTNGHIVITYLGTIN